MLLEKLRAEVLEANLELVRRGLVLYTFGSASGVDREQGLAALERVRESLADSHLGGHPPFTASFGVTDSTCGAGLEHLVQLADAGLYLSKQAGRDRISIADKIRETPTLEVVNGYANGARTRPALHEAVSEEEPQSSGHEIR